MTRVFLSPIIVPSIQCNEQDYREHTPPSAPATGSVSTYAESVGGREMLAQRCASGVQSLLQPHLARNVVTRWWAPGYTSAVIKTEGDAAPTITGTLTVTTTGTANFYDFINRAECLVTVASTSAVAGWRNSNAKWCRGNAAKIGGFHYICRWGPSTGLSNATHRAWVGMAQAAAPTDVDPSTITNQLGMGWSKGTDTNIQFYYNGSGAATKVDTGIVIPTVDRTSVYELAMFCKPNDTQVQWQITDLVNDVVVTGTASSDLPTNTTLLVPRGWSSVGGTSSVTGIALMNQSIETDY